MIALASPAFALTITGKQIKDSSIESRDVKNSTLTSLDVKNSTLTSIDVKNESLTGLDVRDGTIGSVDIADGNVNGADIADGSVGDADLAPISGQKVLSRSMLGGSLAPGTITPELMHPSARGARAVVAFNNACALIAGRGVTGCSKDGNAFRFSFASDVDLASTYPLCSLAGDPSAAAGLTCLTLMESPTVARVTIVKAGTAAPLPDGSVAGVLLLP
jgi:hypothetical protein